MKLKQHERVTAEVAESRAMAFLTSKPAYATEVADAIWPGHSMKPQGAGAAASRILKRLERKKLCKWAFRAYVGSGWIRTPTIASPPQDGGFSHGHKITVTEEDDSQSDRPKTSGGEKP
jgi:hypothetical protein